MLIESEFDVLPRSSRSGPTSWTSAPWKGRVGPVTPSLAGTVVMEERDDGAHRVVLRAKGMEQRGNGAAPRSGPPGSRRPAP